MLQMENHQSAPGGFMGVYTQDWSDGQNRTWFRENTPVNAEDFPGLHPPIRPAGLGIGLLNRAFRLVQPSGETRETWLYTVNCILFLRSRAAAGAGCLAAGRPGGCVGLGVAVVFAPWPQRGMKDLYWCLWDLAAAGAGVAAAFAALPCAKAARPAGAFGLVALEVLIRCMCGFEFVSTF